MSPEFLKNCDLISFSPTIAYLLSDLQRLTREFPRFWIILIRSRSPANTKLFSAEATPPITSVG
jgi:hypothetical protein